MLGALQVVAPDLHLLAGQLVADHVHLQLGVARIVATPGSGPITSLSARKGEIRAGLVAADIDDLVEMADRDQVVGVGRAVAARMQRDVFLALEIAFS